MSEFHICLRCGYITQIVSRTCHICGRGNWTHAHQLDEAARASVDVLRRRDRDMAHHIATNKARHEVSDE